MRKLFCILTIFLNADLVFACQCRFQPITEEVKSADMIFTGKVWRKTTSYPVYYTFSIFEVFKGNLIDSVTIETGIGGGDCGMIFEIGKSYLVYSTGLKTSRCRRNSLIDNTGDIAKLRYIFNPEYSKIIGADTSVILNKMEAEYFNAVYQYRRGKEFDFENKRIAFFDNTSVINKKIYFNEWGGKDALEDLVILTQGEKEAVHSYDAIIVLNDKKRYRNRFRKKVIKLLSKTS